MSKPPQANLLDTVDARTKLAGSNKMEILLFSLGTREIFGINVLSFPLFHWQDSLLRMKNLRVMLPAQ